MTSPCLPGIIDLNANIVSVGPPRRTLSCTGQGSHKSFRYARIPSGEDGSPWRIGHVSHHQQATSPKKSSYSYFCQFLPFVETDRRPSLEHIGPRSKGFHATCGCGMTVKCRLLRWSSAVARALTDAAPRHLALNGLVKRRVANARPRGAPK